MKLKTTDTNYNAVVIKCNNFADLEWCDNVKGLPIFWRQAIVSKDLQPWTVGILFWPEVQLSDDYCKNNNLYRHNELNVDITSKWYIEDNRRVKAIKFRWHTSNALFMPLESLSYLNIPFNTFNVEDTFNEIDGVEVCKKYVIKEYTTWWANKIRGKEKRWEKIDAKLFPEHLDSDNYWRNIWHFKDYDTVIITQKIHGSSIRAWYLPSLIKPKRWQRLLWIQPTKYEHHYGSRRVIKSGHDIKNAPNSYYETDIWAKVNERIKDVIPKNRIIYWELIWWDWDKPIQKNYTYNVVQWEVELYVYRVSVVNPDWILSDLSWAAIKEFCNNNGLKYVPELWIWHHKDFNVDDYMNKNYVEMWFLNAIPLCKDSPCDEWVVVRKEWIIPYLAKAKASVFFEHETKLLDSWDIDLESSQS